VRFGSLADTATLANDACLIPKSGIELIKSLLNEADSRRVEYQYFQGLARMLDEAETRDTK
jgi:hypothetical protein